MVISMRAILSCRRKPASSASRKDAGPRADAWSASPGRPALAEHAERRAGPAGTGAFGRRRHRRAAGDHRARSGLVGHPLDCALLVHARLAVIAHAVREDLL